MDNKYLFLFLASGVINDEGFWLIGVKNSDSKILDDKTLLECHRKELIGYESANHIINAINMNLDNLINELKKIIKENNIKGIIIGYPINMDGTLGRSAQSVHDVSNNLDKKLDIDVCLWDERLSTVGAFNLSSQLDINVTKREKNIDQNAAAFILQGAIDFLNN